MTMYQARGVINVYDVRLQELLPWRDIGKVLVAALVCAPILVAGKFLIEQELVRGLVFGGAYLLAYVALIRALGVWDAFALLQRIFR